MRTSMSRRGAVRHVVMHVAALEQFAQHVAHLLADAEQPDRAAFGGFDLAQPGFFVAARLGSM